MLSPRIVVWAFSVGMMVLGAGVVSAQNYPNKVIRIVTSTPGSGSDFTARVIAQGLTTSLGQQVIVDDRGILAMDVVAKASPDGYTLLVYGSTVWLGPLLRKNVSWDPVRDFSPVAWAASSPNVLVVHPSLPVKSVKELIVFAKARPGELNYASGSVGSSSHLSAELFKAMAGLDIVRIGYKGTGPALNDLVAGHVHLAFSTAASVSPHVKSGRLRALASTTARPSTLLPGLATVSATVPGYEATTETVILAPAGTAATIINRLNREIVRVLNGADVKEKFSNFGAEVVGSSPQQLAAKMKAEIAKWSKVMNDAGISAQ